ncbi:MAG TPA: UDP-N-acetylglucosamine 2-epimerase (non-hydrolyzing) [Gemmatimonadales bacterium]|jgi:UDP-N-acetylglucosamine 2-epimerase (non-hydrolysing)|nr:UDP-N-acetylglucosamine 2-epimerase (non-hydrolyzing) [Gemmatimonadales bacterium]
MIRVLSVFGTRPEAIKMAPVVRALQAAPGRFESLVCVSAQHREMLDQVLSVFGLQADHDLDLMTRGQTPAEITARVLEGLPRLLRRVRPDILLVQGDTMTSFAGAFAAYLERIPSGHVEAGLRTGDRWQPFPEEMNRVLTTRLASIHFAPTAQAHDQLLAEGVPADDVHLTGNTVIDALLQTVRPDYRFRTPALEGLDSGRRLVLITTHRRESFGAPLRSTCAAVRELACRFPDLQFVLPVHPNPEVKGTVEELLREVPGMHLIDPVDYVEFVHLMARSHLILTDSGGVQEEAPTLGKPVLVLREVTERPEGVAAGTAVVVGTDQTRIVAVASELLTSAAAYDRMANAVNPYGDGHASERITQALADRFG